MTLLEAKSVDMSDLSHISKIKEWVDIFFQDENKVTKFLAVHALGRILSENRIRNENKMLELQQNLQYPGSLVPWGACNPELFVSKNIQTLTLLYPEYSESKRLKRSIIIPIIYSVLFQTYSIFILFLIPN